MPDADRGFAEEVIAWQRRAGRHSLPWQGTRDPYRVWLSEIMLQQTQVSTVLAYYPRFLSRFPDVQSLASAPLDEVLGLWSGLGYYTRARNLHRCATLVVAEHGGVFPASAEALAALPGIGRSTAAAIAAFCFGERAAILDGNVKRVLTRAWGVDDDLSVAANEKALWRRAESVLPTDDLAHSMPAYTQGLMDLGATVCARTRPACTDCPLALRCVAKREGNPQRYPVKTRRLRRSQQSVWLLHVQDRAGRVWLTQREPTGIWAALHCLPAFDESEALWRVVPLASRDAAVFHTPFRHVLTHRDLDLHLVSIEADAAEWQGGTGGWYADQAWKALGLPAPIRKFLLSEALNPMPLFKGHPTRDAGAG